MMLAHGFIIPQIVQLRPIARSAQDAIPKPAKRRVPIEVDRVRDLLPTRGIVALITWVPRIDRPAIEANIRAETARLDEPLRAVVTWLAKRLERAEPELIDVAAMWLDVIADYRRCDDAAIEAKFTQRMLEQLVPSDSSPASGGVPPIPLC